MHKALVAIVFAVVSTMCFAQAETGKLVEPVAIGQVYLLSAADQTLKALPAERWKDSSHSHGWPIRTTVSCLVLSGNQSSFRVRAGDKIEFVFKLGNPEDVTLHAASQTGKARRVDYSQATYPKYEDKPIPGVEIEVQQYGQSYKLLPKSPLIPGEYVINAGTKLFTFGVD